MAAQFLVHFVGRAHAPRRREQEDLGAQLQEAGYERDQARATLDEARGVDSDVETRLDRRPRQVLQSASKGC